jgi:hypothetical protein
VFSQFGVGLVVSFELFFGPSLHTTADSLLSAQSIKISLNQHERLVVGNVLGVNRIEIALAKAQIMHCIQNIGLPTAIVSQETIDLRTKGQIGPCVVLEMDQMKFFEAHCANFLFLSSVIQSLWRRNPTKKT